MLPTALKFSHQLLQEVIRPGDYVVDATMGNGHDTAFLADLVGLNGEVLAFDVQKQALQATEKKLADLDLLSQTTLFPLGHEYLDSVLAEGTPITAAIFNLGYLPKSDKQVITQPTTTHQALTSLLPHLTSGGRIVLVVYYGHPGGAKELTMLQEYTASLPQDNYNVMRYEFINQQNQPPVLFCIERKHS
ncbi:class I SAM-dependent methyltransferase [Enterococcus faecalis]